MSTHRSLARCVPKQVYDLIPRGNDWLWPNVLVGNELCFMYELPTGIVKYNLLTREISLIDLRSISSSPHVLTTTEDGKLGFATVDNSRLYLWSREDGPGDDAGWAESRVIELESLLPGDALFSSPIAIGFAAGVGSVFVATDVGVFSIDLRSQRARKMLDGGCTNIVPYMRFYTPGIAGNNKLGLVTFGAAWASTCEELSLCDSSA
ncbi:hypothetical protein EJB05_14053 [Eragrostis curvula]|uniref:Uncharacterized protein n=1 Tax=Eragrostis curvula TaxID=38414 RepID=A0A5J9VYB3_9POAL|nr:hypothetical protein EJB05_14053 [Eragrostis curvula]